MAWLERFHCYKSSKSFECSEIQRTSWFNRLEMSAIVTGVTKNSFRQEVLSVFAVRVQTIHMSICTMDKRPWSPVRPSIITSPLVAVHFLIFLNRAQIWASRHNFEDFSVSNRALFISTADLRSIIVDNFWNIILYRIQSPAMVKIFKHCKYVAFDSRLSGWFLRLQKFLIKSQKTYFYALQPQTL